MKCCGNVLGMLQCIFAGSVGPMVCNPQAIRHCMKSQHECRYKNNKKNIAQKQKKNEIYTHR